jgi:hypothetical protein
MTSDHVNVLERDLSAGLKREGTFTLENVRSCNVGTLMYTKL